MAKYWNECPKCGSEQLLTHDTEFDDDYAWRDVECEDCGFSWQEIYNFSHNEDGVCGELDDDGNVK